MRLTDAVPFEVVYEDRTRVPMIERFARVTLADDAEALARLIKNGMGMRAVRIIGRGTSPAVKMWASRIYDNDGVTRMVEDKILGQTR
jgi:hypothetical protein